MKHKLMFVIVLVVALAVTALPVVAQETSLNPNEELVMNWIDASVHLDAAQTAAKDMLASDFVFYGANDNMILDKAGFVRIDAGKGFLPVALNCVVKSEHDLVEASYLLLTSTALREEPRTILFRIENGQIAEAWLGHTL